MLIDFGLASLVTPYQVEGRFDASGTVAFMAPEQARRSQEADHRVDVFGLGAILKFLLTGRGPYPVEADADRPLTTRVREGVVEEMDPPRGSSARRTLCEVANRALRPDPDDRYQTMQGMLHALRRARSRRRLLWAGAAAVAIVAVAAIMAATLFSGEAPDPASAGGNVSAPPEDPAAGGRLRLMHGAPGAEMRRVRSLADAIAPGDQVLVTARLNTPLYAYVLHAGPRDDPRLIYPNDPTRAEKTDRLRAPSGEGMTAAEPGAHVVLLVASDRPLEDAGAIERQMGKFLGDLRHAVRSRLDPRDPQKGRIAQAVKDWRAVHPHWQVVLPQAFLVRHGDRTFRRDSEAGPRGRRPSAP
jgi:hypothetical protein